MKLTDFEVIKLGFSFLCSMPVFEIILILPHQYKNLEKYQTGISSWPLVFSYQLIVGIQTEKSF